MVKKDINKENLKEIIYLPLREIVYVGIAAIIVYILINWDKVLAFANWLGLQ